MEYTQFGRTALHVSKISYGTWQFGGDWGHIEREQREEGKATVRRALELGINFFDTAQAYGFGLSERMLGEALRPELRSQRDKITLTTKGGLRMEGSTLLRDASARWLRQGVEQSLRNLGVDYIDLYQAHWPDPNTPIEETASALENRCGRSKGRGSWMPYSPPTVSSGAISSERSCLIASSMASECSCMVHWRMDCLADRSRHRRPSHQMTGAARASSSTAKISSAMSRS